VNAFESLYDVYHIAPSLIEMLNKFAGKEPASCTVRSLFSVSLSPPPDSLDPRHDVDPEHLHVILLDLFADQDPTAHAFHSRNEFLPRLFQHFVSEHPQVDSCVDFERKIKSIGEY
jgi:hypothetical protein